MGDRDAVFDETYLQTYAPWRTRSETRERRSAPPRWRSSSLAREILDCPMRLRPPRALARRGRATVVTGLDRSAQLSWRRPSDGAAPRSGRSSCAATTGELPFADASFDAVLQRSSRSLGYLEHDEDVERHPRVPSRSAARAESSIVETAHRDGFARLAQPFARRTWEPLPDGSLYLEERSPDWAAGTIDTYRVIIGPSGERIERPYVHPCVLREGVARDAPRGRLRATSSAFGAWDGVTPIGPGRVAADPSRPLTPMD